MTKDQQNVAIARATGRETGRDRGGAWVQSPGGQKSDRFKTKSGDALLAECCDDFTADQAAIQQARRHCITTTAQRVKYLNTLRVTVGRRCPKNVVGAAIVSDYDLLDAEAGEQVEALLKTLDLWVNADVEARRP